MEQPVTISLIIATYNGQNTLDKTLASINRMDSVDDVLLNIIIINNNSTDQTATMLEAFECQFALDILFQPKAGKNAALNTIFDDKVYLGELLIFSDDDVIFPKNFITKYYSLYKQHKDFGVFGGRIAALWPSPPDPNLLAGINPVVAFAITPETAGYFEGEIDPIKLHGPNMAIVKQAFSQGLRFNENIGPNGGDYVMGSETDMLYQLKRRQIKAYYCSSLEVQHIIRPAQLTTQWLAARAVKAGRSLVHHHLNQNSHAKVAMLFGYPRWAVMKYVKDSLRHFFCFGARSVTFYQTLWARNHIKGYLLEYVKQNKSMSSAA